MTETFIRGGTDIIEGQLSQFRNVIYLCPHRHEKARIWRNAMDRYGPLDHTKLNGRTYVIDFGSAFLRFLHLDGGRRNYEIIQSCQAVTILHPETMFEHGRDEELASVINHRNSRYGNSQ